jgi:hypothetical protein
VQPFPPPGVLVGLALVLVLVLVLVCIVVVNGRKDVVGGTGLPVVVGLGGHGGRGGLPPPPLGGIQVVLLTWPVQYSTQPSSVKFLIAVLNPV